MTLRHRNTETRWQAGSFGDQRHALGLHLPRRPFARIQPSALFSPDRHYRYRLVQTWDTDLPRLALTLLCGCSADEHHDHATARRCIHIAKSLGYGGVWICNIYAATTTEPDELWRERDPIGPHNDAELGALTRSHDLTLLAWGDRAPRARARVVARMLWQGCLEHGTSLAVLGWTQTAQPREPMDVPADTLPACLTPTPGVGLAHHEVDDPRWGQLIGADAPEALPQVS